MTTVWFLEPATANDEYRVFASKTAVLKYFEGDTMLSCVDEGDSVLIYFQSGKLHTRALELPLCGAQ